MDPVRFDRLARFAARRPSRRALLGAVGGGLLAALAGRGAPAAADACDEAFAVCLAHAQVAFATAALACGADAACRARAEATYGTAVTLCQRADERCRQPASCALACEGHPYGSCGPLTSDCTCACGAGGQPVCRALGHGICLNDTPCGRDSDCVARGFPAHCIRQPGCGTGTACVPPCV